MVHHAPRGHTHYRTPKFSISGSEGCRYLNRWFKMTALVELVGREGIFEALGRLVFERNTKNLFFECRESIKVLFLFLQ